MISQSHNNANRAHLVYGFDDLRVAVLRLAEWSQFCGIGCEGDAQVFGRRTTLFAFGTAKSTSPTLGRLIYASIAAISRRACLCCLS